MDKSTKWKNYYVKKSKLGQGGNAKVYRVMHIENKQEFALKQLNTRSLVNKARFVDEINIIKNNFKKIEGIIPILDFSVDEYWYTMPIATPAIDYIIKENLNMAEIVQRTIELCSTLEKLHEQGIAHRDIKPDNIYYYENRFCLGDFGLVDFPETINDFTRSDRGLGAIFTIAPEMKRNPKEADGKKADVFSLAKTMWMFLTRDVKGFDGVYDYLDTKYSLRFNDNYRTEHIVEVDELLRNATNSNPDMRPTIHEFKKELSKWSDIYLDSDKSQASDWNFLNKLLFGLNSPESSSWRNVNKIVETLNVIGMTPAYNHMLFHNNGGLDFSYATVSEEEGCIKLYDTMGFCHIVKPKTLYFEGFDENFRWNYFLLELDQLNSILENHNSGDEEYLVEDSPGHYVSAKYAQYGVYDYEEGTPLPSDSQVVYRYTKGKFLIVMKSGPYNGISGAYDGRHGDCNAAEFREYTDSLIRCYSEAIKYAKQDEELKILSDKDLEDRILSLSNFNRNPFKTNFIIKKNRNEIIKSNSDQKKTQDYIKQNFMNWDFSNSIQNYHPKKLTNIKFAFKFNTESNIVSIFELYGIGLSNFICKDGYIRNIDSTSDKNCYYLHDRETAVMMKENLEKSLVEIIKENNLLELEEYNSFFSIISIKCGKPLHLFTKQEIAIEMRNADDRLNNQLIIDENGYAKVIPEIRYGYLFPVRHELWNAGNVYVGKYSNLSTLDDNYVSSLQGWLQYLQSGRTQYIDYTYETNEYNLLKEIKKHYL